MNLLIKKGKIKIRYLSITILFTLVFFNSCRKEYILSGDGNYFGQKPPGEIPEIFAPGVISTRYHEHSSPCISSDLKEMFYTLSCDHGHVIMHTRLENGKWTRPAAASFSGKYSDDKARFSLDGAKLFFRSQRPFIENSEPQDEYRDWMVERTGIEWGNPKQIIPEEVIFTHTKTRYINKTGENTGLDVYISNCIDGRYSEPERMGYGINTDNTDAVMYIDPDEKFILLASSDRQDQIGIMDIYISFRNKENTWSKPVNLGNKVNRPGEISRFPSVSPDGKYLFFWSNRLNSNPDEKLLSDQELFLQRYEPWAPENGRDGDIYWVSTEIFEDLKPDEIK
ncbi:hypothetical protein ACFL6O_03950 [candidate division KSB1 bacterium]